MMIHALALFVSAALALWVATRVARTAGAGTKPFVWLCVAVAVWCGAGTGHALATTVATKLLWAKVQYLGIATAGPFWLLFTADYAGARLLRQPPVGFPPLVRLLWLLPAATVILAGTNEWHHLVWTSVAAGDAGRTIYRYGPWFWAMAGYNYALLAAGSVIVVRRALRAPAALRTQFVVVLAAAVVPWVANLAYLARLVAIDLTPLAFAVSSLLFAWALFRAALFDLVPVAREVVIDSLSDAIVVTDAARRLIDMNAAAVALARSEATLSDDEGWLGRPLHAVLPMLRDLPLRTTELMLTSAVLVDQGDRACFEVRVLPVGTGMAGLKFGRAHRALDQGRPAEGAPSAWVVLLRDVTEQRRASAEREALERRVQEQDRRESVSILAAGVAHEFNNLLTGIVGNADLLAMQVPASSTMGTNVGEILMSAQRAAALVSKMLAYAGEGHAAITRVDLDELTRESVDLLRATTAGHCEVVYTGSAAVIDADPAQVRQVASNLVVNAAEAVADGGRILVSTGTATLRVADLTRMRFGQDAPPGEYAFLDVRDDGSGMDEVTMRRLFKPFFTTKPIGHGLGLAMVQGVVLGHRGALEVESRPGEGSRFRVWFPVARATDGSATAAIMRFDRTIRGDRPRTGRRADDRRLKESA